jgi:hypothetical protein
VRRITVEERRARLVRRHRLAPADRAGDAVAVARSLVALHATDPVTVFLSVQARTDRVAPADVERTLYDERALVRVLCMRRTLFAVPRDLVPVVYAACTRTIAARHRVMLEQLIAEHVSSRPKPWLARAAKAALAALEARGEASTQELAADVELLARRLRVGAGTRFEATQSVAARLLPLLAMERHVVRARPRGSWINGQFRWALMETWLGERVEVLDPAAAQAELARRWLAAFGPATELDLRWWAGWTAREARAALAAVPHETVELDGGAGLVLADDLDPVEAPAPAAALLPTLDPTTMGWKQRDFYLGPHAPVIFDSTGNAGPTVWWDGRVVGGWAQRRDGEIAFRLLEDAGADAIRAVEQEAARLAAWLGDVRFTSTFLPPFQRSLAA